MNKGHRTEVADFIALVEKGGKPLIPFSDIVNVTLTSFAAVTSAREGRRVFLEKEYGELSIQ
jgi:predicted dehydrogenase